MVRFEDLLNGAERISVIGLGYVGYPLALAFSTKFRVIGYDCDTARADTLRKQAGERLHVACCEGELENARFHIVAVPTPVTPEGRPDLTPLRQASRTVGKHLLPGSVVVYESTVYPGVTEEVCVPVLEQSSGLTCGRDFFVGYSPERVNPGDAEHRVETVVKIVSGMDDKTSQLVSLVYRSVVTAGIRCVSSIRVAESAKLIENAQRDVNIAFVNELSKLFDRMKIDLKEVLDAAGTKWNFAPYRPGLVGGHCIGVDSAYLVECAAEWGCGLPLLCAGREINLGMGRYVAEKAIELLLDEKIELRLARVAVAGFTFKEDVEDIRNTGTMEVIRELHRAGIVPQVCDPVADPERVRREYGVHLIEFDRLGGLDLLIVAVGHRQYRTLTPVQLGGIFGNCKKLLIDVKGIYERRAFEEEGFFYWRL